MYVDILIAEIGSTTTVVNAFNGIRNQSESPLFVGQGQSPTTVLQGDVTIGLQAAIENLKKSLHCSELIWDEMFASSSAAGGLRMSVHGLVYNMTVRAAKEAALGAGAIIKQITAGKLRRSDLQKIKDLNPNIILVAGGVDFGERDTALGNFEAIASLHLNTPIIYAGNIENHAEIQEIAEQHHIRLSIVDNVYPKVDVLQVEPTRKVIQAVFEEHIVHAPGMQDVRQLVSGKIIPTPGAVMEAAKLFKEHVGNVMVVDVGGATTDIHSVTEDTDEIAMILVSPEPMAKRTVEGDLGVYINLRHVAERIGVEKLQTEFPNYESLLSAAKPIPETAEEIAFVERMTREAVLTALERHAGNTRNMFTMPGKKTVAEGKDLTGVQFIIGTGGALTRLPNRASILAAVKTHGKGTELYPKPGAKILIDHWYIMASLGVLGMKYPDKAMQLLQKSLSFE